MGSGIDGWQVMAEPLAIVLRVGGLVALALGVLSLWDRALAGPRRRHDGRDRGAAVADATIVRAYRDVLLDGWPPGELLTYMEAGRRAGTSGAHVRTVVARHLSL